ncbi:uncharacterized protein DSM5745_05134 [Aspergillus mulundensis]|uniref:Uncharacterized protein n=1 Tax=Aspergillus mulundensis TaxID=1810919 RepID=A0A3D8S5I9_9EURO|nr:hypothetical protein DSM5745_05134 [Aspergillus mulundensis]RDW81577.1 hypothetical protein DSM5745_05134 [Aspergillus mulundensis]
MGVLRRKIHLPGARREDLVLPRFENSVDPITAFNAIIRGQSICMIVSFGRHQRASLRNFPSSDMLIEIHVHPAFPALTLLLPAQISQSHPISALNMNYTILVMAALAVAMALAWFFEGRTLYSPPLDAECALVGTTGTVVEGCAVSGDGSKDDVSGGGEDSADAKKVAAKNLDVREVV